VNVEGKTHGRVRERVGQRLRLTEYREKKRPFTADESSIAHSIGAKLIGAIARQHAYKEVVSAEGKRY
jgi:hypothetical protein